MRGTGGRLGGRLRLVAGRSGIGRGGGRRLCDGYGRRGGGRLVRELPLALEKANVLPDGVGESLRRGSLPTVASGGGDPGELEDLEQLRDCLSRLELSADRPREP